jgi:2-keto-4-pentenoate hydratase/2-oxohepta-3-ene-1,7-dioic acid hydratase in catechol pathway
MRFVSFSVQGRSSFGVIQHGGIVDLGARFGRIIPDLVTYIEAVALSIAPAIDAVWEADYRTEEVALTPVIQRPSKIICVGVNYDEHRQEMGRQKTDYPTLFTRFADTLVGHGGAIVRPRLSTALDYEGELAVIIGREAKSVKAEHALDYIAGFACFNDATVRDWQRHTTQFLPGKNFPSSGALGPEMVSELPELGTRSIVTRLNGQVVQQATLGQMIFSVAQIIAYITSFTRLVPGDVIATGTPAGVGYKREPPVFMKAGDTVEVLIDGVGHLVNTVVDELVTE